MKKIILSLLFILALLTATAICASALNDPISGLYVGGVEVTENNASDVLGDGTVSYDYETKTLTLNEANITSYIITEMYGDDNYFGIYTDINNIKINLIGENTIDLGEKNTKDTSAAIYSDASIEISGDGKLKTETFAGILSVNDTTVRNCEIYFDVLGITAKSGDIITDGATLAGKYSVAIGMGGDITVKNTTVTEGGQSYMFMTESGDISIEDSSLTTANTTAVISTYNGSVSVKNTAFDISSSSSCIFAEGGGVLLDGVSGTIKSNGEAAYCVYSEGDIEVKKSDLDVTARASTQDALGICSHASVKISDSNIKVDCRSNDNTAVAIGNNIGGGDTVITNCKLDLNSSGLDARAICGDNVKLTDSTAKITATAISSPDGTGIGLYSEMGDIILTGCIVDIKAVGSTTAQDPSACILTENELLAPMFIKSDVKLYGNVAMGNYPDLSMYGGDYGALASDSENAENAIEFKKENLNVIKYLHIYPIFDVTYDANGGSGEMDNDENISGAFELPGNGFTAPKDKVFIGWAFTAEGDVITEEALSPLESFTLYAIWDDVCNVEGHASEDDWTVNEEGHIKNCKVCGVENESGKHSDEDENGKCDVCGYESDDGDDDQNDNQDNTPHVHKYLDEWKYNETEHYKECECGEKQYAGEHIDQNENGSCDICGSAISVPKDGLGAGAIVGIVIGSVAVGGIGGFSIFWFAVKKKKFSDLITVFKKKK